MAARSQESGEPRSCRREKGQQEARSGSRSVKQEEGSWRTYRKYSEQKERQDEREEEGFIDKTDSRENKGEEEVSGEGSRAIV